MFIVKNASSPIVLQGFIHHIKRLTCMQVELIAAAVRHKQAIISCMGAGGKLSPHLVQVCSSIYPRVALTGTDRLDCVCHDRIC
jgi:tRNA A37 threonylcarbamoyladenosine dehydratase